MIQPWFDPNRYAWIPGTAYACGALIVAAFVIWLVPQGRARKAIVRAWISLWAVAAALILTGLFALMSGQPWGVWYGLLLPGIIGATVVGANLFAIFKRYRDVEERRLASKDFM